MRCPIEFIPDQPLLSLRGSSRAHMRYPHAHLPIFVPPSRLNLVYLRLARRRQNQQHASKQANVGRRRAYASFRRLSHRDAPILLDHGVHCSTRGDFFPRRPLLLPFLAFFGAFVDQSRRIFISGPLLSSTRLFV